MEIDYAPKIVCAACCAENPRSQRFCGDCGARLADVSVGQDEIRVATVLFADVVDFTALTSQLELETIKSLMDRLFERVYRVVVQHGGVIDKYIGDCAMALFGAPVAYGEDATRAVRAALALQRQVGQLRRELISEGLPALSVRVGLNTGPLIAGAVGAGPQRRYTVMGDTVNTAESLQQRAPVGGVLIGEATHRRVRGMFEVRRHAPREYLVLSERYGESGLRPPELSARPSKWSGGMMNWRACAR